MTADPRAIVLFDGVCNFCNGAVNFIIARDPQGRFQFASLQSEVGQRLRAEHGLGTDIHTMAVVVRGRAYVRSSAALEVARRLSGAWPLLYATVVIPAFLRDALYKFFAARRYKWFGKSESCRVPTPDVRARFLDAA